MASSGLLKKLGDVVVDRVTDFVVNIVDRLVRLVFGAVSVGATNQLGTRQGQETLRNALPPVADPSPAARGIVQAVCDAGTVAVFYALCIGLGTAFLTMLWLSVAPPALLPREASVARRRTGLLFWLGLLGSFGGFAYSLYVNTSMSLAQLSDLQAGSAVMQALLMNAAFVPTAYLLCFGLMFFALVPTAIRVATAPLPWRPVYRWLTAVAL